ncbi:competence/damage-inducible protein A [Cellulophaga baltica]|uniref:competence/damage-inducible protein A n=1 Tax=Cellulophaga TaxID=104264 RepID=UPI001C07BDD4|nr:MULTISPECIES: competence/damage-inducible protein A [Cellulophaga]MBU2998049.1 competence/damage-inducible protein A [Cellulophaga baltica]MDO6769451.1 competence/damage-inducible protein A [Cellulophaga sp. 1_MG-2023]
MQAEIITIGDEILIGQIVDTNSAFIAEEFNKIGLSVYQITSVQDDRLHILQALENAEKNVDVVIITGGLGPTKDDITKHTLCEYFNDYLKQDDAVLKHVEEIFAKYSDRPLLQVNKDQALLPSKATTLFNEQGTAPGMWMKSKSNTVFVSLPGVPFEMKALIKNQVIPKIQSEFKLPFILHKTIVTYGVGESALAAQIEDWENQLPAHISLAYLPSLGSVRLRLSAKGDSKEAVNKDVNLEVKKLYELISDVTYGEEGEDIHEVVVKLLKSKNMTLATAESFTGGSIASKITAKPGSSAYYKGTVVSYATEAKINVLQIPEEIINTYSVVSKQVVEAMALNVKKLLNADFAIATTGNAGPEKGDSNEEVGDVFIAVATPSGVYSEQFKMGTQRERVVQRSVNKAFELLEKEILNF